MMKGSYITIENGNKKFNAYLAVPEAGHGPGIVLCQEIFGVNAVMREKADFLAEEGYTVVVPDLFGVAHRALNSVIPKLTLVVPLNCTKALTKT